jgi:hypothetical protein
MSDFCYSRSMFDRVFRQAELMDRMMERVGVNAAAAVRVDKGMAWYEAQAFSEVPEFCHNAEFFRCCR